MAQVFVGTSGFSYPEWKGRFYPAGLPAGEMLAYYARVFPTCEINNTFYRYPGDETLSQWAAAVPASFRFTIKVHRRITHIKRLADVDGDLAFLYERMRLLGPRLSILLFQLPPSLRCDLGLLTTFLAQLRPGAQAVIEFRHDSWRRDSVYRLLEEHGVSLVVGETDEETHPREAVGPIAYYRFHRSRYTEEALRERAGWVREQLAAGRDVYAYFTHEEGTPGYDYARWLPQMVDA
ncbi:MAG: DUF72 domain-containing protein [Armatimonadota bacterium]|nr:DUF72 domain-containing protein [Armatimonadota bacterium]MDR7452218.1 DUF72 domain-containing protein [Armatimonadota bacterium]MDR7466687.1 DUF72 domain-containing protein [Armatimonadota bacterium]MDR7492839.1 DUF72 domain-containing protein [Armatimonadota bacterium]MDR7498615.1 DUF72 domain-containing protein [Armatimonadota bacterium]